MANPANYQRSGTEGIRSNEQTLRSGDLNSGLKGSGTNSGGLRVSDASTKRGAATGGLSTSGTKSGGLSTFDASVMASAMLKRSATKSQNAYPAKVETFKDESV